MQRTLAAMPAIAITLLQNKQVTGRWTVVPEMLSQYQYGVPAGLTFQPDPVPHRELTPQQEMGYKMQLSFRGAGPDTVDWAAAIDGWVESGKAPERIRAPCCSTR